MINYKKSLLSLATILAIGSTSASADYIPLSQEGNNNKAWVLFGVNGFVSEGSSSSSSTVAGEFSISDTPKNVATDVLKGNVYGGDGNTSVEKGTHFGDSDDTSLGKVKYLLDSSAVSLEVRVDLENIDYNERDPERTIYVSKGTGSAIFALKYKASLEGLTAQFSTDSDKSNAYTFTIKSEYTYNNPAQATLITASTAGADDDGTYLSKLSDIVDYNLSNNPSISQYKATYQDKSTVSGKNLRVYSYNAGNTLWELYDSRNDDKQNDFLSLEKTKAYWAKINDNDTNARAGLVLGSSTLTPTDYTNAQLTDGWNLIAFDAKKADLRVSTTGIIFSLEDNASIKIEDSSEKHSVTTGDLNTSDIVASCLIINQAIKTAEINGTMPNTLHLKAFPSSDTNITLISDKRFTLYENADATIGDTSTLAGARLLNAETLVDMESSDQNFSTAGVQSKYGEYALIIKPLLGKDTAAEDSVGRIEIEAKVSTDFSGTVDLNNSSTLSEAMTQTVANIDNNITTKNDAILSASQINVDYGDAIDHILIASNRPFFIRDHTFTRSFKFEPLNDDNGTITISSIGDTSDTTVTIGVDDNITNVAKNINDKNITGFIVDANVSGDMDKLYFIENNKNGNEFYVTEGAGADKLTDVVPAKDIANGAVKGVYSLEYLSKRSLTNTIVYDLTIDGDGSNGLSSPDDNVTFNINGTVASLHTLHSLADNTTDYNQSVATDVKIVFDLITKGLKEDLEERGIVVSYIDNNCTDTTQSGAVITIKSPDLNSLSASFGNGNTGRFEMKEDSSSTQVLGKIADKTPDLSANLEYNAIYTPDYVAQGPLYTLKDAGFNVKSLVTGTMDLDTEKISWESIDLTKKPSEWLDSQDYNLFSVDAVSGYWAYLESATEATLDVINPNFKPNYKYHFNEDGTSFNTLSGNLALEVTGLDEVDSIDTTRASATVNAYVAGTTIALARTGGSNVYTGKISSYAIGTMVEGAEYEIFANVADGLGSNLQSKAVGITIDYKKPTAPVITEASGLFSFVSPDAISFYLFKGAISESDITGSDTNFLTTLDAASASSYALCSKLDAINDFADTDNEPYTIKAFAIDGTGALGGGNASDVSSQKYLPMLKSAMFLKDVSNGDSDPVDYQSPDTVTYTKSCEVNPTNSNYGVTLTAETDYTTAQMAFNYKENRELTSTPLTMFVKNATGTAKITYPEAYGNNHERLYVSIGDTTYALKFQTEDQLDGHGDSSDTAIVLGDDTNVSITLPKEIKFH